jgi:lipoprotein-anchoring transpeptidase ErfK/SrfK
LLGRRKTRGLAISFAAHHRTRIVAIVAPASIGAFVPHGCIRGSERDGAQLRDRLTVGMPIVVKP